MKHSIFLDESIAILRINFFFHESCKLFYLNYILLNLGLFKKLKLMEVKAKRRVELKMLLGEHRK